MTREDILRALREEFRENTRSRLLEMTALVERLKHPSDDASLRELGRHFHGLAGLGGTYGYRSVTVLSREGEDICDAGLSTPSSIDSGRLEAIVSRLVGAINDAPDNE